MTKLEFLVILRDHEWSWKEGCKVYCQTCGVEFKDSTKNRKHRKDCSFAELQSRVVSGDYIMIQNPSPGLRA